jgi:hypothetical protein
MWTDRDISEALLLGTLILSFPFIYVFTKALLSYLLNRFIPRDAIIEYKENGTVKSTYYVKRSLFKQSEIYKLNETSSAIRRRTA